MNKGLEIALKVAQVGDLPPEIDKDYKKHWLKAIVKIQRTNGDIGYCLAVNDGSDKPNIVRDPYPTGIIAGVLSIHPYEECDKNILPRFQNDEQVVRYLCKSDFSRSEIEPLIAVDGKTPEQIERDRNVLRGYIKQVAIKQASALQQTIEYSREISAMADPKLKEKNKNKRNGRTTASKTKRNNSKAKS